MEFHQTNNNAGDVHNNAGPGEAMCPHCGRRFSYAECWESGIFGTILEHAYPATPVGGRLCPGSLQGPRNPESDRRPLWKDLPGGRGPTPHEARPSSDFVGTRALKRPCWTVRELTCEGEPCGQPFTVKSDRAVPPQEAAELAAMRLDEREHGEDALVADGTRRYIEVQVGEREWRRFSVQATVSVHYEAREENPPYAPHAK